MTEKPLTWKGLVATAKTFSERIEEAIQCCIGFPYNCINCDKECGKESLVSFGLVLRLQEQLKKISDKFPKAPNDNAEKILFIQWAGDVSDWLEGLREVLGEQK